MNFEFVDFYPISDPKNKKIIGTVHVYIFFSEIDFQFDLRGIRVFNHKNNIFFRLPTGRCIDPETKKKVLFPFFGFAKKEDEKKLKDFLSEKVNPIIKEKIGLLSDGKNSLPSLG